MRTRMFTGWSKRCSRGHVESATEPPDSDVQKLQDLLRLVLHQGDASARLDVETHQRLGVRASEVEAPLRKLHGQAVREIHSLRRPGVNLSDPLQHSAGFALQMPVDLAAGRKQGRPL